MTPIPDHDPTDYRKLALANWITANTPESWHPINLQSLGSDAGFRRYFRFQQPSHWLGVDAPPATEDSQQFAAIAKLITSHKVHAPGILASDIAQGFLLVEDMGDRLLFRELDNTHADQLYRQAIDTLLQLQTCEDNPTLIPRYDRSLLRRELEIFTEWFVGKLLNYQISSTEQALLNQLFGVLEDNALSQPQCFVHRDYHSRNLILRADDELGVIDFQGALWGAITYDLVSLLRDCYVRWPTEKVDEWAGYYYQQALNLKRFPQISKPEFLYWFDLIGLQRHIKVLGIFARLFLRDNKPGYLQDLPLVIRYIVEVANQHPLLHPFAEWFDLKLLPLATTQFWYNDHRTAGDRK
ncbi:MAG TPA: phosphotransferase [Cellvibrio sp.]|nr:phosphotransferase [Cellvibrio sp.]